MLLNPINNHLAGYAIFTANGNDNVRIAFAGLYECLVHRLYSLEILINNRM